jgi:hypothetical protein
MKRESGENPEQTRCCKLDSITNYKLRIGQNGETMLKPLGDREGVSSKSKSEDLPK